MSLHLPIKLSQIVSSIFSGPHKIVLMRLCFTDLVDSFVLYILAWEQKILSQNLQCLVLLPTQTSVISSSMGKSPYRPTCRHILNLIWLDVHPCIHERVWLSVFLVEPAFWSHCFSFFLSRNRNSEILEKKNLIVSSSTMLFRIAGATELLDWNVDDWNISEKVSNTSVWSFT